MKKIISTLIMICMLTTLFSTFVAADPVGININSVTYDSSGTYFYLTINGSCIDGSNITVRVKNENGTIKALKQFKVKDADVFSYKVTVNTAGDEVYAKEDGSLLYTVYVRDSLNNAFLYDVPLYTETIKKDIVDKMDKVTDVETMVKYIELYQKAFGFDLTYFGAMKEEIAGFMVNNKTQLSLSNVIDVYNDSVIRAYLFNEDMAADRTEIIEYPDYDAVLKFAEGFDGAKSLYPEYKAMNSDLQKKVNEIVFVKENSADDFVVLKEKLFMAVIEVVFAENKDDSAEIYKFLKKYNDWLKLEKLEEIKTYEAYRIILDMADEGISGNKADFVKLYNKIYAQVCKKETVEKPSSGGGGGGGGAPINKLPDEIGYEKPEVPEIKPVETITFSDLDNYPWAKEAIESLATKGVVNGKGDNKFAPGDNITREEFAKIITIAFDLKAEGTECDFADVEKDRWSYEYICAMYENAVITGYPDGTFKPANFVTREEMAVMLCRVLVRLNKIDIEYENYSSYNDYDEISDFAQNSVRTLSNHGILSGDDAGCFNPKAGATRAEVCKMIYNTGL